MPPHLTHPYHHNSPALIPTPLSPLSPHLSHHYLQTTPTLITTPLPPFSPHICSIPHLSHPYYHTFPTLIPIFFTPLSHPHYHTSHITTSHTLIPTTLTHLPLYSYPHTSHTLITTHLSLHLFHRSSQLLTLISPHFFHPYYHTPLVPYFPPLLPHTTCTILITTLSMNHKESNEPCVNLGS